MPKEEPRWRRAFDALEEPLRRRAEALAGTEEFSRLLLGAFGAWTSVARGARSASTTLLHSANLPAHADLRHLARRLGVVESKLDVLAAAVDRLSERIDALAVDAPKPRARTPRRRS